VEENVNLYLANDQLFTINIITMKKSYSLLIAVLAFLPISLIAQTYNFTSAGVTGISGPNQAQVNTAYTATTLDGDVTVSTQGIQEWTVPVTGTYTIEAAGAKGGGVSGGNGAYLSGDVTLTGGQTLYVIVGQRGGVTSQSPNYCAGGGGGSFVYLNASDPLPIMAAAGGGGQSEDGYGVIGWGGAGSATATTTNNNTISGNGPGGTSGNGGSGGIDIGDYSTAGGGAGWLTNGQDGLDIRYDPGKGGHAPVNDGMGGLYTHPNYTNADGGFGGGGSASDNSGAGGGGGGFNGGGGGSNYLGSGQWGAGGGAGSYNSGINQSNTGDLNITEGFVTITLSCSPLTVVVSSYSLCDGEELNLSAASSNGGTISWDNGVVDGVSFTPPVGTNTYTATSTDLNDCSAPIVVDVNPTPNVDGGSDVSMCEGGGSITLSGSGNADTYSWDNGALDGVAFVPANGSTDYIVTGTITATGCEYTDTVNVTVGSSMIIVGSTSNEIYGNDGWIDISISGGIPPFTYSWDNGLGAVEDPSSLTPGTYTVTVTDSLGCTESASYSIITVVGIDENDITLSAYPNPTTGELTISMNGEFDYSIYNLMGQIIVSGSGVDIEKVDLSSYDTGAYILRAVNGTNSFTLPIVKK